MKTLWGARRTRRVLLAAGTALVAVVAITGTVLADPGGWFATSDNPWPYESSAGRAPVLAAVGDISCQPGSPQEAEKKTDVCDQGVGFNGARRGTDGDREPGRGDQAESGRGARR